MGNKNGAYLLCLYLNKNYGGISSKFIVVIVSLLCVAPSNLYSEFDFVFTITVLH